MKATLPNGILVPIKNCYIDVPIFNNGNSGPTIPMNILPDISDGKSASYPDESAQGRSMPFKTFQNSDNRSVSWTAHFMVCQDGDQVTILNYLRTIEACTYPMLNSTGGAPYAPPPICRIRCGDLLSDRNKEDLCAILKSYSVKFDPSVPWDEYYNIPYKLDVDMQFEIVYDQSNLPGAENILDGGI